MSDTTIRAFVSRRRSRYFGVFLFVIGLALGCVIGFFFLRHVLFFLKPPPFKNMVAHTAGRIRDDFKLDDATSKAVEDELQTLFGEIRVHLDATRKEIEKIVDQHVERIELALPEGEKRQQWREKSREYLPPPPPGPPGGPRAPGRHPGPPPPGGPFGPPPPG